MAATQHLPYGAYEDEYLAEIDSRFEAIEAELDDLDEDEVEDDGTDNTSEIAGLFATWMGAQLVYEHLRPEDTIPTDASEYEWFDEYLVDSYKSAIDDADNLLREAGYRPPTTGINDPRHREGLNEVFERARHYWQKLADDMEDATKQAVSEALESDGSIRQARRAVDDRITHLGKYRGELIGQSEPARAYNWGLLKEYENAGVDEVRVEEVDWTTAGDDRVCAKCAAREGTYSIKQAKRLLKSGEFPAHARCRCVLLPA